MLPNNSWIISVYMLYPLWLLLYSLLESLNIINNFIACFVNIRSTSYDYAILLLMHLHYWQYSLPTTTTLCWHIQLGRRQPRRSQCHRHYLTIKHYRRLPILGEHKHQCEINTNSSELFLSGFWKGQRHNQIFARQ